MSIREAASGKFSFVAGTTLHRRRGFSFAEVMFAVVILGVGFIMVAAIFPIAAAQTKSTIDESVAAQIARSAFHTIQSSTTSTDYIPDGNTHSYGDATALNDPWKKLSGSMICAADQRYAWVPFYQCFKTGSPIMFTVLVVRRSLHDIYTETDTNTASGELLPQNVTFSGVTIGDGGTAIAQIQRDPIVDPTNPPAEIYNRLAPGTYLIATTGDIAGRILRVGELAGETGNSIFWRLLPGYGLNPNETCGTFTAAVIGKDLMNVEDQSISTGKPSLFGGDAQDVSVFSAYLNPQ